MNSRPAEMIQISNTSLSSDEIKFLEMAKDPTSRPILLDRLARLGLLSAFLEAENETN